MSSSSPPRSDASTPRSGVPPIGRDRWSARRRWLLPLVVVAAALALQWAWVESRRLLQPTGRAAWIWIGGTTRWSGPRTAYAFRDFDLDAVPERAVVTVVGDEEYVLYLNGERIGSNRYTAAAAPDRYEVGRFLVEGNNRFAAHLRSSRGFGGLLLTLSFGGFDEPYLVTDGDWKISHRYYKRLFRPDLPLEGRLQATVLGRPPFGRWGTLPEAAERPLHTEVRTEYRPQLPRRAYVRGSGWRRIPSRSVGSSIELPQRVLLDWGGVIDGYLTLAVPEEQPIVGLAYLGLQRPDPVRNGPDAYIVSTPGQAYWEDAVPRRFRFALLVGVGGASNPRVVPTDGSKIEPIEAGSRQRGVLGRPAPRLASPLEDEVWGELERLPGDAQR